VVWPQHGARQPAIFHGRKRIIQFWRTLAIGFLALVLPQMLVSSSMIHSQPWLLSRNHAVGILPGEENTAETQPF
jgi:hypothetical protein